MARNLNSKKRREIKARQRELKDGDIVQAIRFVGTDKEVSYYARVNIQATGQILLESIRNDHYKRIAEARTYYATFPILGYRDWYMISNLPVFLAVYGKWRSSLRWLIKMAPAEA